MSNKANELALEVQELLNRFGNDRWHTVEAVLQIIDREKVIVLNRYRKKHGEPELIPEPKRYKNGNIHKGEWLIDVPKEWVNLISKVGKS